MPSAGPAPVRVVMPDELGEAEASQLLGSFDGLLLIGGGDLDPETYGQSRNGRSTASSPGDGFEPAGAPPSPARCPCWRSAVVTRCSTSLVAPSSSTSHPAPCPMACRAWRAGRARTRSGCRRDLLAAALKRHRRRRLLPTPPGDRHAGAPTSRPWRGRTTAWSRDRATLPDQWVIGVQWHPEDTAGTDVVQQRLFDALVGEVARSTG